MQQDRIAAAPISIGREFSFHLNSSHNPPSLDFRNPDEQRPDYDQSLNKNTDQNPSYAGFSCLSRESLIVLLLQTHQENTLSKEIIAGLQLKISSLQHQLQTLQDTSHSASKAKKQPPLEDADRGGCENIIYSKVEECRKPEETYYQGINTAGGKQNSPYLSRKSSSYNWESKYKELNKYMQEYIAETNYVQKEFVKQFSLLKIQNQQLSELLKSLNQELEESLFNNSILKQMIAQSTIPHNSSSNPEGESIRPLQMEIHTFNSSVNKLVELNSGNQTDSRFSVVETSSEFRNSVETIQHLKNEIGRLNEQILRQRAYFQSCKLKVEKEIQKLSAELEVLRNKARREEFAEHAQPPQQQDYEWRVQGLNQQPRHPQNQQYPPNRDDQHGAHRLEHSPLRRGNVYIPPLRL